MSNLAKHLQPHGTTDSSLLNGHQFHRNDPEYYSSDEDSVHQELESYGITTRRIYHNASVPVLYEQALKNEKGTALTCTGALVAFSGTKTGRSPKDKRIVEEETSKNDVWFGPVNIPLSEDSFMVNRERAVDYLNTREQLYVFDGFAGWDKKYRIKIRVISTRAYHALFMRNMLIRPTPQELMDFGEPDYIIYNAGEFPANRYTKGMTSPCSISINFKRREMVILGSQYAGEMKKGVFTIMHYLMPKQGVLSLHSSCNEGKDGTVSLFFGLSGTGKTTLSADPNRYLIGDDEHVWTEEGVFNIEGGCYAKCIGLKRETEPEIYDALHFGSVLENVVMDEVTRQVEYESSEITENTRACYPLEFIPNAKIPAITGHPNNIILLTCDAFGVLPPVSKLTIPQTMYHFISGYTAKVAGTEVGVTEPQATFSACFGEPFLVLHPTRYAEMLADKLKKHSCTAWLVNTGWVGGSAGSKSKVRGKRCPLKYTRAIIDAIHNGELAKQPTVEMEIFGLHIPTKCTGVPDELLIPKNAWPDKELYNDELNKLCLLFNKNFSAYADKASEEVIQAGPKSNTTKQFDVKVTREA
ncbi:hypothetical protein FDP41_001077 [Naegleria fowleri]|uniref:Phosphoenolpyruvate carboxykinase (ATP) n=1 Tax=Naegleria fowleri TaxID=5763 RepID=A0A6A5C019_NAEFO|nr:uncharacterized protein FDP41_001077 [Naegleria fowleri]KAF0979924.1 hypothetical protein FDP41_001077 [Naegleria fowleri]CAG4708269.1 unnamed protein product [Naegleria fowleri]